MKESNHREFLERLMTFFAAAGVFLAFQPLTPASPEYTLPPFRVDGTLGLNVEPLLWVNKFAGGSIGRPTPSRVCGTRR